MMSVCAEMGALIGNKSEGKQNGATGQSDEGVVEFVKDLAKVGHFSAGRAFLMSSLWSY